MPDKKGKQSKSIKDQILDLLTHDKDVLQQIVEALSVSIVDKLLESTDIIKNLISTLVKKEEFQEALCKGKQEVYESVSFDLQGSVDKFKSLEEDNDKLKQTIAKLEDDLDTQHQYSRRNCILIHKVEESDDEVTDDLALKIFKENLNIEIPKSDLDRTHRIGRKDGTKTRPIIVKFATYNRRSQVFRAKRNLKGKGISITESLTPRRLELLKQAKEKDNVQLAWTSDGRIICLLRSTGLTTVVENGDDLSKLSTDASTKPNTRHSRKRR